MIKRVTKSIVENESCSELVRASIILIVVAVVIGFVGALLSFSARGYEHISVLFPEMSSADSVYIPSRGFPFAQWVSNETDRVPDREARSALLPMGILANTGVYSVIALSIMLPLWAFVRLCTSPRDPPSRE